MTNTHNFHQETTCEKLVSCIPASISLRLALVNAHVGAWLILKATLDSYIKSFVCDCEVLNALYGKRDVGNVSHVLQVTNYKLHHICFQIQDTKSPILTTLKQC